jgi:hypothetical protein
MALQYIPVTVYRCAGGDSTNGGVSASHDVIYVLHEDGAIPEATIPPYLRFAVTGSRDYRALVPLEPREGFIGPMDGGNIVLGKDARLPGIYHIHDRWEDAETYAALSR